MLVTRVFFLPNCFCSSLLRTLANSQATSCIGCALSNEMNNDRADGCCHSSLPAFKDIGRSVTPIQFSFNESFSLPIFYVKRKNEENLSTSSSNLLQNAPSNSVLLALRLSVWWFQMPLEGLSFVKTLETS